MRVFGIIGWKDSGKTHLMVRLISEISSRGVSVSSIKHAHHSLEFSTRDEAGHEQRPNGTHETIFASPSRWSLLRETSSSEEDSLAAHLARLQPVDLVLVEGYKREGHPKLEAYRAGHKRDLITRTDTSIVAVASDTTLKDVTLPSFDLNDTSGIADFILEHVGLTP